MNYYGNMAQKHWAKWRPNELSQIPDPEEFFSSLGQEVEIQVDALAAAIAGDDPGGEGYLAKVGRLRMARFDAEGQILREMVLLPPEPGHPEAEDEEADEADEAPWLPMVLSPDHPNYHDFDGPGLRKIAASDPPTQPST